MDRRLLGYYNRELQYLRELGGEFAREFPKIAGRLGLDGFECADPYVERLLEGFAFLAARVQLKIDAEFPRFTEHMLELIYPHYLAPTPSMAVVQLVPNARQSALAAGFKVPRGSALRAREAPHEQTACEYRTAHEVTLWPLELTSVAHSTHLSDIGEVTTKRRRPVKAALRMTLRAPAGIKISDLALDELALFVRAQDPVAQRVYELLLSSTVGMLVRGPDRKWTHAVEGECVRARGFEDDEAMLPYDHRSFQGYRLLHEYFAFPSRFSFVELTGLAPGIKRCHGSEVEIIVLLDRHDRAIESSISPSHINLYCTPAINLFARRADAIHLTPRDHEYHVVPDRNKPLDLEVHSVLKVTAFGAGGGDARPFLPFYANKDRRRTDDDAAYYTVQRRPRLSSTRRRQIGPRSSYDGGEVFLSLVDGREGPYRSSLRELSVDILCTNRDLPLQMTIGEGRTDFLLESGGPLDGVRCVAGPSAPRASHAWGEANWRLLSHLSLNYLSLVDAPDGQGATSLREMLKLYSDIADPAIAAQIDGVRAVSSTPSVRRIPVPGPATFGRGLEITLQCDESGFEGTSVFLFASVLERFFAKYVSMNSFTETVLRSTQRGEIMRWPARIGRRPTI
jgi:type VI secretion system protein ImpG